MIWALVLLVVLFVGFIRFRLREMPIERDEGEYAYTAQLLLQGVPPFKLAYTMKLPGTAFAYALIMAVFGQTPAGIHLGLLIINAATILLVFLLGRRLMDNTTGLVACAAYGVMSTSLSVMGPMAHATQFVVLPALGGILLLYRAAETGRLWRYLASGFLFGLAFLMKQPGLFLMAFGGVLLLWLELQTQPADNARCARHVALFCLGAALPFGLTCLYLAGAGVFDRFWFWTFTCVRAYGDSATLALGWRMLKLYFGPYCGSNIWLWLLGGVSLIILLLDRKAGPGKLPLIVFLIVSFAATSQGLYFRPHYFILTLPALALVIGAGISSARRLILSKGFPAALGMIPAGVFVVILGWVIYAQEYHFFFFTPTQDCQIIYQGNPVNESPEIGRFIQANTAPGDTIAVIGSEPQIYFYSHRRSATGYIYMYNLVDPIPFATTMQQDMIREVENAKPEMIVLVKLAFSWNAKANSEGLIFDWADQYCHDYYDIVGVVDFSQTGLAPGVFYWGKYDSVAKGHRVYVLKRKAQPVAGLNGSQP